MSWTVVLKNMFINSILLKTYMEDFKAGNSCLCSHKAVLLRVYCFLCTIYKLCCYILGLISIISFAKAVENMKYIEINFLA